GTGRPAARRAAARRLRRWARAPLLPLVGPPAGRVRRPGFPGHAGFLGLVVGGGDGLAEGRDLVLATRGAGQRPEPRRVQLRSLLGGVAGAEGLAEPLQVRAGRRPDAHRTQPAAGGAARPRALPSGTAGPGDLRPPT